MHTNTARIICISSIAALAPCNAFAQTSFTPLGDLSGGAAESRSRCISPEGSLIGNMTFAGVANQTETIATWITRLEEVRGWVNAWVNSAQEDAPFSRIYTFSNGLDLTQEAATARGQGVEP